MLLVTTSTALAQFGAGLGGGGMSVELLGSFPRPVEVKPLIVKGVDMTPRQTVPAVANDCSVQTKGGLQAKTKARCKKK